MKKLLSVIFTVLVVSSLVFVGCAEPAPAPTPAPAPAPAPTPAPAPAKEPIVLKLVSFMPRVLPGASVVLDILVDKVKDKSNGELIIDYLGGPEVIPVFDQATAVQSGTMDMASAATGAAEPLVPGSLCLNRAEITLEELRKGDAYDFINEQYKKAGLFLLGFSIPVPPNGQSTIFLTKKVEKIEDFAGLKMGTVGREHMTWFQAMGLTPIKIDMPEVYTALERGTVDGIGFAYVGVIDFGLQDVIKYALDHNYSSYNTVLLVNLEKWNSLPKHLQDIMTESMIEVEQKEGFEAFSQLIDSVKQDLLEHGVQFLKFPPDSEKKFYDLYRQEGWKLLMESTPEITPKLKELLTKK